MQWNACALGSWLVLFLLIASPANAGDDSQLVEAAKRRDEQAVRALLKQHVDVNAAQADGAAALHWAAQWDDVETVELLIRAGADVNKANEYGITPLWLACTNGSAGVIDKLLSAGADADARFPAGETALMTAARTGNVDPVKLLLARGVDVNAVEPARGQAALMWAAAEGYRDVVRVLIEHGANVRARSTTQFTPLLFAARTGDVELVHMLLNAGAHVNEAAADGTTALLVATIRSHTTLGEFLLAQGADPNRGAGFTPLHWAVGDWYSSERGKGVVIAEGHKWSRLEGLKGSTKTEFVKVLLAYGADPNVRADRQPPPYGSTQLGVVAGQIAGGASGGGALAGATPFFVAAKAADATVMRLLVAAGADPGMTNKRKRTPLMMAAGLGVSFRAVPLEKAALEAVKLAVELGNDVNAEDESGDTALHGATYRGAGGSTAIIPFLVNHGARVNVTDEFGWTPLAIAEGIYSGGSDTRSDDAVELLRRLGAEPTPPDVERDVNVARLKARQRAQ